MSIEAYESGRYRTPPPDLIAYIKQLEKRIKNLETNSQTASGSMTLNGTFTVRPDGTTMFKVAQELTNGEPGIAMWREDGSTAMSVQGSMNQQFIAFWDNSGNIVLSNDAGSGFGIARPWLNVPFYDPAGVIPVRTTTSSTFDDLQYAEYNCQHPYLKITVLIRSSDGSTTGETTIAINGTSLASSTQSIAGGEFTFQVFNIAASEAGMSFGQPYDIMVQGRRTAGSGTIGARVMSAYGRQT